MAADRMSDEPRRFYGNRLVPIISGFIASLAAGVLVIAFEPELRALNRAGALILAAILVGLALLSAATPAVRHFALRLYQLPSRIVFIMTEMLLYLSPLLFVIATLIIVYATKPPKEDLLTFLQPFGPVLAGCGGAISIVAAAASDVVYHRALVWRQLRFEAMLAMLLVISAAGFNRFGYSLESWGMGVITMNFGIFDVHKQYFAVASLASSLGEDRRQKAANATDRKVGKR